MIRKTLKVNNVDYIFEYRDIKSINTSNFDAMTDSEKYEYLQCLPDQAELSKILINQYNELKHLKEQVKYLMEKLEGKK